MRRGGSPCSDPFSMSRNLEAGTENSDSNPALIEESRCVAIGSQGIDPCRIG